jgi:hypothetical protein
LSIVPLGATGENVFVTHTDRPAFEMGSGVPNLQPTSVQSTPAGVEPAGTGPMLQTLPTQFVSVKRFAAPAGVALSGTCEMPPPSDRLPQRRFLIGTVPARSRKVLPHVPVPAVDRKSMPEPPPIVVVVGAIVVGVTVVDDDELDDVDELVELVVVVGRSVVGMTVVGVSVVDDDVLDVVGIGPVVDVVVGTIVLGVAVELVDDEVVVLELVVDDVLVGRNVVDELVVVGGMLH